MKKILIIITIFFIYISLFASDYHSKYNNVERLDGEWKFYWNKLLPVSDDSIVSENVIIPSYWNHYKYGFGTYIYSVKNLKPDTMYAILMNESPGTASCLYINGRYIGSCGEVSTIKTSKGAITKPWLVNFYSNEEGTVEIAIQVSNWIYRKAGLWSSVFFGEYKNIIHQYNLRIALSTIVLGMVFFLFITNILLFILNRKRKDSFIFALITFCIASRLITAGFNILELYFPKLPFSLSHKIEYLLIWAGPSLYVILLNEFFPELAFNKGIGKIFTVTSFVIGGVCSVLPIQIANYFVTPMIVSAFVVIIWIIFNSCYKRNMLNGGHEIIFSSLFLILAIIVIGMLLNWIIIITGYSSKYSPIPLLFTFFTILQFIFISISEGRLYKRHLAKSFELNRLNKAYNKFVPKRFMELLGTKDIVKIELGNHVEMNVTVLFLSINNNGTIEEQYDRFSLFAEKSIQVISDYNGFLSKFINNGLMALFPNTPEDAVLCAAELEKIAYECGSEKSFSGVNFGKTIVGLIGEKNRLDDTVISDTINTCYRIMQYSISHQIPILASSTVVDHFINQKLSYEKMNDIKLKGKLNTVTVYRCSINDVQEVK